MVKTKKNSIGTSVVLKKAHIQMYPKKKPQLRFKACKQNKKHLIEWENQQNQSLCPLSIFIHVKNWIIFCKLQNTTKQLAA